MESVLIPDSTIQAMVKRLVDGFQPLRVVLFGSCARGDATRGSDVDLLVVMPEGTHTRRAAVAMLSARRCFAYARAELQEAQINVEHGGVPYIGCFHAQQAAEKAMKAAYVWQGADFARLHDLDRLG